jgi:hypothetical protein
MLDVRERLILMAFHKRYLSSENDQTDQPYCGHVAALFLIIAFGISRTFRAPACCTTDSRICQPLNFIGLSDCPWTVDPRSFFGRPVRRGLIIETQQRGVETTTLSRTAFPFHHFHTLQASHS